MSKMRSAQLAHEHFETILNAAIMKKMLRIKLFIKNFSLKVSLEPAFHPIKDSLDATFHHDMARARVTMLITK